MDRATSVSCASSSAGRAVLPATLAKDDDDSETRVGAKRSTTNRNERRDRANVTRKLISDLEKEVEELKAENKAKDEHIDKLRRQRDTSRVRAIVERGRVMELRRSQGVPEDLDGDSMDSFGSNAVNSGSDDESQEDGESEENSDTEESTAGHLSCLDPGANALQKSEDEASEDDEPSQALLHMELQFQAINYLVADSQFAASAGPSGIRHLKGLLQRASDASREFLQEFDEVAIQKWGLMLQRAVARAIEDNPKGIVFCTGEPIFEGGERVGARIEPACVWNALPLELRYELLDQIDRQ